MLFKKSETLTNDNRYRSIYHSMSIINRTLLVIIFILLILLFIAIQNNNKPPIILRYTTDSIKAVETNGAQNGIVLDDVKIFAEHFIRLFNLYDSFSLEDKIPRALSMMDSSLQDIVTNDLLDDKFLSNVINSSIKTRTNIQEISLEKSNSNYIGYVVYERLLSSLDSNVESRLLIRTELVIEELPKRSKEYPYGLKVMKYKEYRLNQ